MKHDPTETDKPIKTGIYLFSLLLFLNVAAGSNSFAGSLVKKSQQKSLVETEYGEVSAVKISAAEKHPYHLEFITLDPNSLFLPVLLHSDMVFYVHTDPRSEIYRPEMKSFLRRIDVNRIPATANCEEEGGVSSPNNTISSVSGKRSERDGNGEENEIELVLVESTMRKTARIRERSSGCRKIRRRFWKKTSRSTI